jgi:hypothetical protein
MKHKQKIPLAILLIALMGCATLTGNDPVVVNAEKITQTAFDTMEAFKQYEFNNRATLESINPAIEHYANVLRRNEKTWLQSARTMTDAYKNNRNAQNKANLDTALAVLSQAVAQITQYMAQGGAHPQ